MKEKFLIGYEDIISMDNLLSAWREFVVGKRSKPDVMDFSLDLMDNILQLHSELGNKTYRHGGYESFYITDPKLRHIHKASVRDRLIHHAVYRRLCPLFEKIFIPDSYSCRLGKGTHKAVVRLESFIRKSGRNNTIVCWTLKCDIKKFFASVDHGILLKILSRYIDNGDILNLLAGIIGSFENKPGKGLPLGNLTSQLFANVYMNGFDWFAKHRLKAKYYIRYTDDFIILSDNRSLLVGNLESINGFLRDELKLSLHAEKVSIKTASSGLDFLGWVNFTRHRVLRKKTKQRMIGRIMDNPRPETLASYLGLLKHGNAFKLKQELLNSYWLWKN
ncbi:MAG: reverse transcriptase domain-containing protein [Patescibacteria group bacterium]